jgi:mono/diheme cytochrome c family protein
MTIPVLKQALALLAMLACCTVAAQVTPSVAHGAYLAKLGDCVACHTAPKGRAFAGGLPMQTPVGTIYATNITPDRVTGIGGWTLAEFDRALRRGVSKDGHNLYPAMPYPSYAKVSTQDVSDLYAYFMSVAPVRQPNRPSGISFPLNMRWPLALWNLAFLDATPYKPTATNSVEWNRGAYLTQGLGHCGACHTPRGVTFQEKALDQRGNAFLSGAELDGWFASNLTGANNAGLGRWSQTDLEQFLRIGANRHASAFGPMTEVVNKSSQYLSDVDVRAMAVYLKSLPARADAGRQAYVAGVTAAPSLPAALHSGAGVYAKYCASCHGIGGRGTAPWLAPLAGNPNVLETHPGSLINVTLNGTPDLIIGGRPAPYPMPGFARVLSDQEVADVVTYIRAAWRNDTPGITTRQVAAIRKRPPTP